MSAMFRTTLSFASVIVLGVAVGVTTVAAPEYAIDTARSGLKIRVFKSGIFSAFAHDKEIEALVAEGTVHFSADPRVALRLYARDLRVMDPELSRDKGGDVQKDQGEFTRTRCGAISGDFLPINCRSKKGRAALDRPRKPHPP